MITLLGRCPSCGVETMSRPFFDLAGLGKMLAEFEPIYGHYCPTRRQSNSCHGGIRFPWSKVEAWLKGEES
jgi:hypothetical protein